MDIAINGRIPLDIQHHRLIQRHHGIDHHEVFTSDDEMGLLVQQPMRDVGKRQTRVQSAYGAYLFLVIEGHGHCRILHGRQFRIMEGGFIKPYFSIERLIGMLCNEDHGDNHRNDAYRPCRNLTKQLAFMALPNGIKLHTEQLGNQLHIGPLLVQPGPAIDFLMDIGAKDFGQTQLVNDRVEALRLGITAMGSAVDDEKVNVLRAPEAVEKLYLLPHPLRLGRVGRTDDDKMLRGFESFL